MEPHSRYIQEDLLTKTKLNVHNTIQKTTRSATLICYSFGTIAIMFTIRKSTSESIWIYAEFIPFDSFVVPGSIVFNWYNPEIIDRKLSRL